MKWLRCIRGSQTSAMVEGANIVKVIRSEECWEAAVLAIVGYKRCLYSLAQGSHITKISPDLVFTCGHAKGRVEYLVTDDLARQA